MKLFHYENKFLNLLMRAVIFILGVKLQDYKINTKFGKKHKIKRIKPQQNPTIHKSPNYEKKKICFYNLSYSEVRVFLIHNIKNTAGLTSSQNCFISKIKLFTMISLHFLSKTSFFKGIIVNSYTFLNNHLLNLKVILLITITSFIDFNFTVRSFNS